MQQSGTVNILGLLIAMVVVVTIIDSYVPHEIAPVRQLLAFIIFLLMVATMWVAMRSVLREF